jgi:hypothetical protein
MMKSSAARRAAVLLVFFLFLTAPLAVASRALAAEPCGTVEEARGVFWATRGGKKFDLSAGGDVFEFDILETAESGAATVRFADGSLLEMREDTRVNIKEVVFSDDRNRFNVGVVGGAARVMTGMIVKRNPAGFKVTMPRAVIGIRGTTLAFAVGDGVESVTVEEVSPGNVVIYSNTATGETFTMTLAGGSITTTEAPVTDPVTGETKTTIISEPGGEGVLRGDRDARGYDKSGAGDNPRRARPRGSGGNGSGSRGGGSRSSGGGDDGGDGGGDGGDGGHGDNSGGGND